MLKRNRPIDREDLEAQQERINYQNSLNSVLQAVRDLTIQIALIKEESFKNYASLHAQIGDLKIRFNELLTSQKNDRELFIRFANDSEALRKERDKRIFALSDRIKDNSNNIEITSNKILGIINNINIIKDLVDSNYFKTEGVLSNYQFRIEKAIGIMKEEILSKPSGVEELKKELQQTLDIQKVDFEGLMRELAIWKRENQITQKKIENIYTLIGRLQKALPE